MLRCYQDKRSLVFRFLKLKNEAGQNSDDGDDEDEDDDVGGG